MVNILDIKPLEEGHFSISISLGSWTLSKEVSDRDLEQLQKAISDARGLSKIKDDFSCTLEEATKIRDAWGYGKSGNYECKKCSLKGVECYKCLFVCQSPLEQAMFWEFRKRGIDVVLQRRIRKDGSFYDAPEEVEKETILTIPDFYLEKDGTKLCIYADGKTYHYNNENQGIRDRSIDISLQNLGYKVLRYTGSQIRDDVSKVIDSVLNSI